MSVFRKLASPTSHDVTKLDFAAILPASSAPALILRHQLVVVHDDVQTAEFI